MNRIGTSKTPYIFHALTQAGCSWSCDDMEMAPFYCAGQAHMRISLLNIKSISLLSLLVFVKQTLRRHQTLLFPAELTDLGEPKSRVLSKIPVKPSLIIFSCFLTHRPVSRKLWTQTVTLWILMLLESVTTCLPSEINLEQQYVLWIFLRFFFFLVFVLLLQDYKVYILKTFIALKVYIML